MALVQGTEREEAFCDLSKLLSAEIEVEVARAALQKIMNDPQVRRESYFQPNLENTSKLQCFIKNVLNDPKAIAFGLHTIANVGSLAAFIALYKKYNNRQKVNQILGFISAFSTWGIHAHQLVRQNNCADC
jgi:hypothetical protein